MFGKSAKEKEEDRRISRKAKEARINRKEAKTDARKKNGGAGFSMTFYEIAMPNGEKVLVKKSCKKKGKK